MRFSPSRQRQRGVALMAMLAVLILGATWWTVTAMSNPVSRTAENRARNAQVLQQAKAAVMGWVAHQAAMATENDPGRLPCPEAAANIGTANQGLAANTCALPAVGRLPWRTLGIDQLRDAAGEPLWYVVSPGWTKPNAATNTVINSNATGQLALDSLIANDVVALIVAPGPPLSVPNVAGACTARNQARPAPGPGIDLRDYLECQNATLPADATFVSSGPGNSPFNDQVLAITGLELLPAIEAAVAQRVELEVAPQIRAVHAAWTAVPAAPLPFAANFGNPTAADFKAVRGNAEGLLPFSYSATPCVGPAPCNTPARCLAGSNSRCDPMFVAFTAGNLTNAAPVYAPNCVVQTVAVDPGPPPTQTTQLSCTFNYRWLLPAFNPPPGTVAFTLNATVSNLGLALRQFNANVDMTRVAANPRSLTSVNLSAADASAAISFSAQANVSSADPVVNNADCLIGGLLGLLYRCQQATVVIPIAMFDDHPLVAASDAGGTGAHWFVRNNWHQVSYYKVAPEFALGGAGGCGAGCLTVNFRNPNPAAPTTERRALIVISGRSLNGAARPNGTRADWLEDENCNLNGADCAPDVTFSTRGAPSPLISRTFNDRVAVLAP